MFNICLVLNHPGCELSLVTIGYGLSIVILSTRPSGCGEDDDYLDQRMACPNIGLERLDSEAAYDLIWLIRFIFRLQQGLEYWTRLSEYRLGFDF